LFQQSEGQRKAKDKGTMGALISDYLSFGEKGQYVKY